MRSVRRSRSLSWNEMAPGVEIDSVMVHIGIVAFLVETFVMLTLIQLPELPGPFSQTVVNSLILTLFLSPAIFYCVVRPLNIRLRSAWEEVVRSRDAALEASRCKSEFLANMSHEIRTPLNGVIGLLELLGDTELDGVQSRYAANARVSADCLLCLINDILDFSKIEAGKLELEETDFDLRALTDDVAEMFALRAETKGIELCCDVREDVPSAVRGDPDRLRQVLLNLVSNAIKFTEKGHVVIRVSVAGTSDEKATLRFEVADTGIGIPAERRDRLFKAFSQVDASTTRKYGGTGLGLILSRRLAELLGGTLEVESELGKGSTFRFSAELRRSSPSAIERAPTFEFGPLNMLIAEDNSTNLEILEAYLDCREIHRRSASTTSETLRLLREAAAEGNPFDVAILDARLPDKPCEEFLREIRSIRELRHLRLILLSSMSEEFPEEVLRAYGVSCTLTKPIRRSRLIEAVNGVARGMSLSWISKACRPPSPSRPTKRSMRNARILLAEDHEINQLVATDILKRAGYHCRCVTDGKSAVEAAIGGGFDLVLMDCQMPILDGFQAAAAIRDWERRRRVEEGVNTRLPIVALTANAVAGDREACLEAGMDDYVTKPIDSTLLIETIDRLLPSKARASQPASTLAPKSSAPGRVARPRMADAEADALEVFDPTELKSRCYGDLAMIRTILDMFAARAPEQAEELRRAAERRDAETIARTAHSIKGVAGNLGASALVASATRLDLAARKGGGDFPEILRELEEVRREISRCGQAIPGFLKALEREPEMENLALRS